jgi:hypothetical protein
MSAQVCDYETWEAYYGMKDALDDIAQRYQLGKYAPGAPPLPDEAEVVDLAAWKASRGRA